jgi:hypothetical protein
MCVYHSSSEAARIQSRSEGPGHIVITCPSSSLSSLSSSSLISDSCFTSVFTGVVDILRCLSSCDGWVGDTERGLLGGIRLNGGIIPPKRGLGVFGFITVVWVHRKGITLIIFSQKPG